MNMTQLSGYVVSMSQALVENIDFAHSLKRFEIVLSLRCFSPTHSSFKIPSTTYAWINTWFPLVPDLH